MLPLSLWDTGQTFSGILVNDIEPSDLSAIGELILHKIITPDMIFMLWAKPDAASIIQPKSPFLWLLPRNP